jgi:Raf kinase inhibitor-like YbhB/YbcL family protein
MRKIASLVAATVLLSVAGAGFSFAQQAPPAGGRGAAPAGRGGAAAPPPPPPFRITSPDLVDGSQIPMKFTCAAGAEAVSPALQWTNVPRGTLSFVLIVHDMEPRPQRKLDDILHWMVWNIPASANKYPQNVPSNTADLPDGSHQTNGNPGNGGITGYRPPCPPQNVSQPHHYAFDLFALDAKVDMQTATRADVMKAIDGHILAHDSLVVPFNR